MLTIKSACWICLLPVWHTSVGICYWCEQKLRLDKPRCLNCALPSESVCNSCSQCQKTPSLWHGILTAADYLPPLSKLLHQFKFSSQTILAPTLSRLILLNYLRYRRDYQWPKPDCFLAVPLHPKRLRQRGFNQSELLAQPLARWLSCRYWPNAIRCTKVTVNQHTLDKAGRQSNLEQVYEATADLRGYHIALVDDVVTTGATAKAIAYQLQQRQVASIQIWCLCRTL
ncbi:hypothetical protein [Rosenbergiella australiborealis]|uniref:hypothetical protein n=1 Tax=Rosenbergiella australiborealis TaxID=1544696 RepID=UPI001F4E9CB0|nr:hypothetical protein [Rosenbergiella australiborealis]